VLNVTKTAVGVRVNKYVNGRILEKRIHVKIEHVRKSKCQDEFLARVKRNELQKAEYKKTGVWVELKRQPKQPKAAYYIPKTGGDGIITTIQPLPFSDLL